MTNQHRATPKQWNLLQRQGETLGSAESIALLELRARVEALEAAQLEQAESHRFCTDAIVRRVEALEAAQRAIHGLEGEIVATARWVKRFPRFHVYQVPPFSYYAK